jgi:hypothetical protein
MEKSTKPQSDGMFHPGGETRRGVTPGKGLVHLISVYSEYALFGPYSLLLCHREGQTK